MVTVEARRQSTAVSGWMTGIPGRMTGISGGIEPNVAPDDLGKSPYLSRFHFLCCLYFLWTTTEDLSQRTVEIDVMRRIYSLLAVENPGHVDAFLSHFVVVVPVSTLPFPVLLVADRHLIVWPVCTLRRPAGDSCPSE